jgi:hypothetical protein
MANMKTPIARLGNLHASLIENPLRMCVLIGLDNILVAESTHGLICVNEVSDQRVESRVQQG